jgi:hypothetical protein
VAQRRLHPTQWSASADVSTQPAAPQSIVGAEQIEPLHAPPMHAPEHRVPHAPQFCRSVAMSEQTAPHILSGLVQVMVPLQRPATQLCPLPHRAPQAPAWRW